MTRMTIEQYNELIKKRQSKYNSVKYNWYDSKKENKRAYELRLLLKAGVILDIQEQVKFTLLEWFIYKWEKIRWISYIADFVYWKDWVKIVEDVKWYRTEIFKLKKKLLLSKYPDINFIET